ncbi:Uncharacterised protein [Gemella haemolysans]|jgi:hypothetical protein|nr:Uncharacterised protein [Gemella haemolysans]
MKKLQVISGYLFILSIIYSLFYFLLPFKWVVFISLITLTVFKVSPHNEISNNIFSFVIDFRFHYK